MRKWISGFTAIFLILLAFDIVPQLRGGWGWQWPYQEPAEWTPVILLVVLLAIYLAGVYVIRTRFQHTALALLWSIVAGLGLGLGVQNVRDDPLFMLFSHTVSPVQTGASTVAVQFMAEDGVEETLGQWPDVMVEAKAKTITHFTTSPPGQALIHHWLAETTDSLGAISRPVSMALRPYQCSTLPVMQYERGEMVSAGWGMLMPLWAALAVIPLFFAARVLTEDADTAVRVAQWWPLVPSLLLFAPTWSTFYPVLVTAALAFLIAGLKRRCWYYWFISGFWMSIATFLNFAVLPVLAFLGFVTLGYWFFIARQTGTTWRWPVWVGMCFAGGLSIIWIVFGLYSGNTPLDILQVSFDQHLDIERNYFVWLVLHPYDLLMFAGWPLAALGLWGLWRAVRHLQRHESLTMLDILALSLVLTIVSLDLSGITRGESARIWLFFVPLVLLVGAEALKRAPQWDMPLLVMQAASVAVMGAVLPVVAFDMNPRPDGPRTDVPYLDFAEFSPVNADFYSKQYDGRFQLVAYRFVADPTQQQLTIELQWLGDAPTERPYLFEFVAYATNDIDGEIVSEPFRWYPQNGNYLTTCWQSDEYIHDVVVMPLPPVSQPVVWDLFLQVYDERTGDRAVADVPVNLGPIPYP